MVIKTSLFELVSVNEDHFLGCRILQKAVILFGIEREKSSDVLLVLHLPVSILFLGRWDIELQRFDVRQIILLSFSLFKMIGEVFGVHFVKLDFSTQTLEKAWLKIYQVGRVERCWEKMSFQRRLTEQRFGQTFL